jgi:hypothetical protein
MYKIIGIDGKIYGPASAEQVRRWIAEGRVESRTPVFSDGAADWTFLGLLPEFVASFGGPPPAIVPPKPGIPTEVQPTKTNSCATAGLVFGILSWVCCCGCPFGLLGLVFSLVALSQINANPQSQQGRGLAIAGLILSATNLFLGIGWLLLNFALHPPTVGWRFSRF